MASLHFTPRHAVNERLAELAFWAVYDRVCSALAGVEPDDDETTLIGRHLKALRDLAAFYRDNDLPRIRDLGRASYEAASVNGLVPDLAEIILRDSPSIRP
jgi:hypothetical protein